MDPRRPICPDSHNGQPRITPRPRVSPAVTSADPLLTRMALGRSNDGTQFGMIFQIFTDGTVIDSRRRAPIVGLGPQAALGGSPEQRGRLAFGATAAVPRMTSSTTYTSLPSSVAWAGFRRTRSRTPATHRAATAEFTFCIAHLRVSR